MPKSHRFNLVLPLDVFKRIQKLAEKNHRSATQEIIVAILERLEREEPQLPTGAAAHGKRKETK